MQDHLSETTLESGQDSYVHLTSEPALQDEGLATRKPRSTNQVARILALIGGLGIAVIGLLGGSLGVIVSLFSPAAERLLLMTFSVSFLALTVSFGLALAWHAWSALQGRRSAPFAPRKGWILIVVFALVVIVGQTILSLDLLPGLSFPPFHVGAAILPPLTILLLAGRSLPGVTNWRDVTLMTASGALIATLLALTLELLVILGLLVAVIVSVRLQPGGPELLQALAARLEDPTWLQDPAALAVPLDTPVILVTAFLIIAVVTPLIEESTKTVGIGLLAYRRPGLGQAFIWGLACGAGFALAESLFNTSGALEAWSSVILLRVGTTLLHCLTGALMGLAWYAALTQKRWGRTVALYAASVGIHGLWNALAAGMALLSLGPMSSEPMEQGSMAGGLSVLAILALLLLLTLAAGAGLIALTSYVRKHNTEPGIQPTRPAPGTHAGIVANTVKGEHG